MNLRVNLKKIFCSEFYSRFVIVKYKGQFGEHGYLKGKENFGDFMENLSRS